MSVKVQGMGCWEDAPGRSSTKRVQGSAGEFRGSICVHVLNARIRNFHSHYLNHQQVDLGEEHKPFEHEPLSFL